MSNKNSNAGTAADSSTSDEVLMSSQTIAKPDVSGCLPKIFCFINSRYSTGDVRALAIAEDGEVLDGHLSSNDDWAKHDMGISSTWKHESYKAKYPNGYELKWMNDEDCDLDKEFIKACGLSNSR